MGRKKSVNIGETINGLEILDSKTVNENGTKRGWSKVCCQICGNKKWMRNHLIKRDRTKSCGCLKDKPHLWEQRGPKSMPWQLPQGESAFNNLYQEYINSSRRRNYDFNLTKEEFRKLTKQNCYYCGREPDRIKKGQGKTSGDYVFNGIDRINNTKGYIKTNTVPCCFDCNNAKRTLSVDEFLDLVKRIHNHLDL